MDTRNLVCTVCPVGCSITVTLDGKKVQEIKGNSCKRGAEYAAAESTNPVRTLTTSVRVINGINEVVPVKSEKPIPKGLLMDCMGVINQHTLKAPVVIGEVVVENILDTGVNIIATGNALEKSTDK